MFNDHSQNISHVIVVENESTLINIGYSEKMTNWNSRAIYGFCAVSVATSSV